MDNHLAFDNHHAIWSQRKTLSCIYPRILIMPVNVVFVLNSMIKFLIMGVKLMPCKLGNGLRQRYIRQRTISKEGI